MREIKKIEATSTPNVRAEKTEKAEKAVEPQFCAECADASTTNLAVSPGAVGGRSQVNTDNLDNDLAFLTQNPDAVNKSDKLHELAFRSLQQNGDLNAYEKACAIATSDTAKELLS